MRRFISSFANQIHEKLEKEYPGLSRGIWGKTAATGNGEYNQSVAPESVLIEIGGVENTLKECYRTADVLAEAIAELYWESQDAEKVDAKAGSF
jgi:stage II sporulation protein P